MRVDVVTLFPAMFEGFLASGFEARAIAAGKLEVHLVHLRDFGLGKHKSVDDTPYGGGSGMVMRVDVLVACLESLDSEAYRVLLTPQGTPFTQQKAGELAAREKIALVCGRYEGFDERVRNYVQEEISLGDFVVTGGEVAAMAILDATVRLLPGVLGNPESTAEESHGASGLLEYPQYTRPAEFRGVGVPAVLAGGHHAEIKKWREDQALLRTRARRPDLLDKKGRT
jgi:tRNA (guanine37-N1)-methyltransferase